MYSEGGGGIFDDEHLSRIYLEYFIVAISVEIALKACTIAISTRIDRGVYAISNDHVVSISSGVAVIITFVRVLAVLNLLRRASVLLREILLTKIVEKVLILI